LFFPSATPQAHAVGTAAHVAAAEAAEISRYLPRWFPSRTLGPSLNRQQSTRRNPKTGQATTDFTDRTDTSPIRLIRISHGGLPWFLNREGREEISAVVSGVDEASRLGGCTAVPSAPQFVAQDG
jgi:hypothetical protein